VRTVSEPLREEAEDERDSPGGRCVYVYSGSGVLVVVLVVLLVVLLA